MAYLPHYRLTARGRIQFSTLGGVIEQWQYGVNLAKTFTGGWDNHTGTSEGATQPDTDQFNDLVADVSAFHSSAGAKISGAAVLEEVKLAWIGADGKYTRDPMISGPLSVAGGGGATVKYPPQIALAVSLGTTLRGPRGRGRFYLPCPAVTLDDSLVIPDSERDTIQTAVATFLTNLGNEPGTDVLNLTPVVASSFGTNAPVKTVRVGRALDTVRSRRRSVSERYDPATTLPDFSG